ncbi:ABC transporter permease [Flavitalea flava]
MLSTYFNIAWRNLWKQKFHAAINIFGLSLGMAGGLILFQFISYHLSYDRYHQKSGQLYRAVTDLHLDDGSVINVSGSPLGLTAALQDEFPTIKDQAVLLKLRTVTISVPGAGQWKYFEEKENIGFTDQHWFNLFDYTWEEGNAASSLQQPNTAVISRRLADKYFGNAEAIGQTIRLDNKYTVTITGVLKDLPANSDFRTELFFSRPSFTAFYPGTEEAMYRSWGFINTTTQSFVWLPEKQSETLSEKKVTAAMARLTKIHFEPDVASVYHFHLQPLKEIHFDGRYGGTIQRSLLLTLAVIGLFLVIIACFNFINLATAQSAKRAREIGTRKVLGSSRMAIFRQFMTETACLVLLATLLSLLWIKLILPLSDKWLQILLPFNPFRDLRLSMAVLLLAILVTATAGFYPAIILSRWKPVDALKKQINSPGSSLFRKGLIVFQNVVVQVLIICTLIITLQIKHLKTTDPGFVKEAVIMVPVPDPAKGKSSYLESLLKMDPAIQAVSFCYSAPLSERSLGGSVSYDNRSWEKFNSRTIIGDADYLPTFGIALLTGRNITESDTVREFLINETLVRQLGIGDPKQVIGRRLVAGGLDDHPGIIVGVVKDFNVQTLNKPVEPVLFTTKRDRYEYAAIKFKGGNPADLRSRIRKAWEAVYPAHVFEYHYLNEQIDEYYHKEDLLNKLINATAAIAIAISCLGLLGLISFFTIQRTKEIGIRKILGANASAIMYMLSKDFLKLVLLSILIASPVAWYMMNHWLLDYAYRIKINWWIFVLAGVASLLIALITVSYQAVKAAFVNPVESLRSE